MLLVFIKLTRLKTGSAVQDARADIAANPVPVEGLGHMRVELERLLKPPPDATAVGWKWEILRDFAIG
jgi:hypothetical protein